MTAGPASHYLKTRAITGPWQLAGCKDNGFAGAVVIPALAESPTLFATLRSLATNPAEFLARFLVIVVVNQRTDARRQDKLDNLATLERLAAAEPPFPQIKLAWVDAASPGLELAPRGGGVGLARKIGADLALSRLDFQGGDPLLISLDADTLVGPDYLAALSRHFGQTRAGGAVIPFRHQQGSSAEEQRAIDLYELFLRSYVLGLELAGSPYAFHTVGSAMACRASAYARMGGMNSRSAGEDFYFLQQLQRTAGVARVSGTVVFPSARASHRVPFGTGRSVSRALAGDEAAICFYRPECFRVLGDWLALVAQQVELGGTGLCAASRGISAELCGYLESAGFAAAWENLRSNNKSPQTLLTAFHGWFDGLRTMKLIHYLSAGAYPRCGPEAAVPELLLRAGAEPVEGICAQLRLLQRIQTSP
jgi:glycosyl transferase family 2